MLKIEYGTCIFILFRAALLRAAQKRGIMNIANLNYISPILLMSEDLYLIVLNVYTALEYVNGKPTENIAATKIRVKRPSDGETFYVKIKDKGACASNELIGKHVTFTNLHGKFYVNARGYLDVSVQATGIATVEE